MPLGEVVPGEGAFTGVVARFGSVAGEAAGLAVELSAGCVGWPGVVAAGEVVPGCVVRWSESAGAVV